MESGGTGGKISRWVGMDQDNRLEKIWAFLGEGFKTAWFPWAASGVIVLCIFFLRHGLGLGLSDEGYFWYGVQRVLAGEIPVLDFRSYDPGRYYWSAFFLKLLGPGLFSLRLSETFFQWGGIFFGLLAARRVTSIRMEQVVLGLVLALWMYPDYKYFDCVMPCAAVYAGTRLLEDPCPARYLAAGVFTGLAAFIGRQHILFLSLAFGMMALLIFWRDGFPWRRLGAYFFGLFCGLLPSAAFFGVPGYGKSYWNDMVMVFLRDGRTNLTLPIPWPWTLKTDFSYFPGWMPQWVIAALTLVLPLAYLFWMVGAWKRLGTKKFNPLLAAAAAVGLPYLQYFYSRADFQHLAAVTSPFWIAAFAQANLHSRLRRLWLSLALLIALTSVGAKSELIFCWNPKAHWPFQVTVGKETVRVQYWTADFIEIAKAVAQRLQPGETFLAYPHLPTLYLVCGLKSPCWDTNDCSPQSLPRQAEMIRQMEKARIQWALIDNEPVDGIDDRRFQRTNRMFSAYLLTHYKAVALTNPPPCFFLFKRTAPFLQSPGLSRSAPE